MNKKKGFFILAILLTISVGAGAAIGFRNSAKKHKTFAPYSITWQVTDYDTTGTVLSSFTQTRFKSGDGRWYEKIMRADGLVDESFAEPGRGVFRIGSDQLHFLSDCESQPNWQSEEEYVLKSPQYSRSETVLGIRTVVLKASPNFEVYRAPSLNGDSIKMVLNLNGTVRVFEPVAISLAEPEAAKLEHKEFPVSYEFFEQKNKSQGQ